MPGAAGVLVRQNPWLQVHVSEVGAPHLVDPTKLESSARRLYGMSFDSLWGELAPIPERNVHAVGDRILGLDCFPTPGHAWHHVSYLDATGTLYVGDAAGVRMPDASFVLPPCPPPELDLEAWEQTIEDIVRREPGRLALIHFGTFDDVVEHLAALRETLRTWAGRVEDGMDEETFIAAARYDVSQTDPELVDAYDAAAPYWHHYRGLDALLAEAARGSRASLTRPRRVARRGASLAERVRLEVRHRDELERRGVRRLEHDRRSDARLERLRPALGDDAPAVAGLEAREQPLRLRGHEVVPARAGEREELLGHDRADDVDADVAGAGPAVAVAIEPGHRVERARLEIAAEDVHDRQRNSHRAGPGAAQVPRDWLVTRQGVPHGYGAAARVRS